MFSRSICGSGALLIILLVLAVFLCSRAEARLLFQTSIDSYDPRIDLRTDGVLIHRHGADLDSIARSISNWKEAGYDVYRMWFIGSDAGEFYVDGKIDGHQHYDEIETTVGNRQIYIGTPGNGRPYMVPTEGWNQYMKEIALHAVDSGAAGIAPEEPLAHTAAGYSPAFKREWEALFGEPWAPPGSSPNAFWKASKLKSDLYLRCVKTVLQEAKKYATETGREVKFILPVHSLISYASGNMIYPTGETFYLKGLDGFIGQVWTGPVGWSLGKYEGKQLTRDTGFFESAWLLYSSFANLVAGSDKKMYLLADPVEDDPSYRWDQYHIWYNQCLVSKLMFPWISDYEVMPWPDRIFLPGYGTGGGTPGPSEYLTQLMVDIAALSDMENQKETSWDGGTQGIGILVGDTLGWQRGGPSGSSMDSLNGLALPLLRKGIPVQILPIERIRDKGYLDQYKVLLLSYDMWKPLRPDYHVALAQWVRRGGVLVFFEGNDSYNAVSEWWRSEGYAAPAEHLLSTLGLKAKLEADTSGRDKPSWTTILKSRADYHNLENRRIYTVELDRFLPAEGILIRFRDGSTGDGWGPWLARLELRIVANDGSSQSISFQCNNGVDERKYLARVEGPGGVDRTRRFADADGSFTYRLPLGGARSAQLRLDIGNNFVVEVMPVTDDSRSSPEAPETLLQAFDEPLRPALEGLVRDSLSNPLLSPRLTYCRLQGDESGLRAGFVRAVGQGHLVYLGMPSATFAGSPVAAESLRRLVSYAVAELAGIPYRESGHMVLRRGAYVIGRGFEGETTLKGSFLDLLNPAIPLSTEVKLGPGDLALLFDVSPLLESRDPVVLYGSHEVIDGFNDGDKTMVVSAGPWQTRGVVRVFAGTRNGSLNGPASVHAYAVKGYGPRLKKEEVDRDTLMKALREGDLMPVDLKWGWDQAHRTVLVNFEQWHSGVVIVVEWGRV